MRLRPTWRCSSSNVEKMSDDQSTVPWRCAPSQRPRVNTKPVTFNAFRGSANVRIQSFAQMREQYVPWGRERRGKIMAAISSGSVRGMAAPPTPPFLQLTRPTGRVCEAGEPHANVRLVEPEIFHAVIVVVGLDIVVPHKLTTVKRRWVDLAANQTTCRLQSQRRTGGGMRRQGGDSRPIARRGPLLLYCRSCCTAAQHAHVGLTCIAAEELEFGLTSGQRLTMRLAPVASRAWVTISVTFG